MLKIVLPTFVIFECLIINTYCFNVKNVLPTFCRSDTKKTDDGVCTETFFMQGTKTQGEERRRGKENGHRNCGAGEEKTTGGGEEEEKEGGGVSGSGKSRKVRTVNTDVVMKGNFFYTYSIINMNNCLCISL